MKKFKANNEHFKYPKNKFINNLILSKFDFMSIELNSKTPCIYLSPKISPIDENLITKCIKDKFVFVKEEIISKLSIGKLSQKDESKILNEIKELSENNFSIAILYGASESIFGENEQIPEPLILFLRATGLDIKFLTFPGEYYAFPIWSDKPRKTRIYSSQKININQRFLEGLSKKEIIESFKNSTPSSATAYLNKYSLNINSNSLANGIERYLYCCPHCNKLLSIYAEFSCVKCRECGMFIEFSADGKILFSKKLNTFDDIQPYQFNCLTKSNFTINEIKSYDNITQIIVNNCKKQLKFAVNLHIYAEKLIIINTVTNKKIEINYEDIDNIYFKRNNNFIIETKNAKTFHFCGNSNENFYIIKDLVCLNKN